MHAPGSSRSGRVADLGPLLLRLGVGVVFVWHAAQTLDGGVGSFARFLDALAVPAPEAVAWLQVVVEGVGGVLLVLGLSTRYVVLPLVAISLGALWLVRTQAGLVVPDAAGAELDVALLAGELALLCLGPGRFSLDALLGTHTHEADADAGHPHLPVAA